MPDKNLVLQIGWGDLGQIPTEPDNIVSTNTPEFKIKIPFGVMLNMTSVSTVNGQTGAVILNAAAVGADTVGSAEAVETLLQPQIDNLSNTKLDAVDYVQHFRGLFSSLVALTTALPTALDGDYAHIDSGAGFDRMVAIWDNDDNAWLTKDGNVAANTDEMPEGATNLYFKSDRVRQTALTGLNTSVATPALATDVLIDAIGKLQAQLNASVFNWVDVTTIAGTLMAPFSSPIDLTRTKFYLAKKDGQLWIKGYFQITANISSTKVVFRITNPNWFVDADYTVQAYPASFTLFTPSSTQTRCYIQLTDTLMDFNIISTAYSSPWTFSINPTCIGKAK